MRRFAIVLCIVMFTTDVFAQFKLNNVDTVSPLNKELMSFMWEYMAHRAEGKDAKDYWYEREAYPFHNLDVNEQWDNYYAWLLHYTPTLLGISKVEEGTYKLKILIETGVDSLSMMIYTIQDFLVYHTDKGFKMGNMLSHNLVKEKYIHFKDEYFDYFYPPDTDLESVPIKEKQALIQKLEEYFGKKMPYRMKYIYALSCEELYRMRGIDYVANMMSTQTSVCGWTFVGTRTMYSSHPGFHKHEILRLLGILAPNAPLVLADGLTNLTGGAGGKPIKYHIQKLAPYLTANPEKLDKIEDFWYYDDETNPYFVFHALITNYFLKTQGETKFKELMLPEEKTSPSIRDFLKEFCGVEDIGGFFIAQLNHYAKEENDLEFANFF